MKTRQAAHDKEREEDKELRARERQEDMQYILSMIQTGVEKELRAAIQPVEERLEIQEKMNQNLSKQFDAAMEEINVLRRAVNNQKHFPELAVPPPQNVERLQVTSSAGGKGQWGRGEM